MHPGAHHRRARGGGRGLRIDPALVHAIDMLTYGVSVMMLLFTIHQVAIVWLLRDASGVSLVAWLSYTIGSFVWLMYGYVHRDLFLIIVNFTWTLFAALVVVGVILFGQ